MPWNDNANPGPWGSPPDPDEGGESAPRPTEPDRIRQDNRRRVPPPPPGGPDFQRWLRDALNQLRGYFGGAGGRGIRPQALGLAGGAIVVIWLLTGLYTVDPRQEAVVTRFGTYAYTVGPGLHYHMPAPIERVERVAVTTQQKTEIGGSAAAPEPDVSLMLTGDENIVDLRFTVQWHVNDPVKNLFSIRDPEIAVQAVGESAMREVVGHSELHPILTTGKAKVQSEVATLMQRILDTYNSGVTIDAVQIRDASPPADVVPAYQGIAKAQQDAQSLINQGNTYRNKVVFEAKGTAAQYVQSAQGYREQAVREAEGEAAAFNQVYAQYRLAPAVTRERLYLETMQAVLAKSNKVIVDTHGATAPIILPPDAFRPRADASVPAPAPAPAPPPPTAAPITVQPGASQ